MGGRIDGQVIPAAFAAERNFAEKTTGAAGRGGGSLGGKEAGDQATDQSGHGGGHGGGCGGGRKLRKGRCLTRGRRPGLGQCGGNGPRGLEPAGNKKPAQVRAGWAGVRRRDYFFQGAFTTSKPSGVLRK